MRACAICRFYKYSYQLFLIYRVTKNQSQCCITWCNVCAWLRLSECTDIACNTQSHHTLHIFYILSVIKVLIFNRKQCFHCKEALKTYQLTSENGPNASLKQSAVIWSLHFCYFMISCTAFNDRRSTGSEKDQPWTWASICLSELTLVLHTGQTICLTDELCNWVFSTETKQTHQMKSHCNVIETVTWLQYTWDIIDKTVVPRKALLTLVFSMLPSCHEE